MSRVILMFLCPLFSASIFSQDLPRPTVLEVKEDDRVATIYWNSMTDIYDLEYDPDKRQGIFSYLVEWGEVGQDFTHRSVTPYRVHQIQPLDPGKVYQARISALGKRGTASDASETVQFRHDPSRVDHMRTRLNGFFDDMNLPAGPFDELKWNQSYSGCMKLGHISQHINTQFHGHNVIASGYCDRGMASSRVRQPFDFRDRTGVIEFDLDGAHRGRHAWYLDLTPFNDKRDLTGHINAVGDAADPPQFLRIEESGADVKVYVSDQDGVFSQIPDAYQNDACGDIMIYCPGENLAPVINVRKHWRIELSKNSIRIFINDILVVNGDLDLTFEVAQINWLSFSYNTNKENLIMSMVHWDNFGFDAPTGTTEKLIVHNYTDGKLGTETDRNGNERSIGMAPTFEEPSRSIISIPDEIVAPSGETPLSTELMFTLQGGHQTWTSEDRVVVNGNSYPIEVPEAIADTYTGDLVGTNQPYSRVVDIDPSHLLQGDNQVEFYFDRPRILNVHIELTYRHNNAPDYSPPGVVFEDHQQKLMQFRQVADEIGPGLAFQSIDGDALWTDEYFLEYQPRPEIDHWYVKQEPVEGVIPYTVQGNSWAQLAAKGTANGIQYYVIYIDQIPVDTIRTDLQYPVAALYDTLALDTRNYSNGTHEFFIQGVDVDGNKSIFDGPSGGALPGAYIPTIIDIQNQTTSYDIEALTQSIDIYPNPSSSTFEIVGELGLYDIDLLSPDGSIYQNIVAQSNSVSIDLSDLPNGMYFIRISNRENQRLTVQKILKQ